MNTNYSTFNYNSDFTPQYNIFNVNTTNKRYVGIGTHIPNEFLDIIGNVSTTNLFIHKNIYYTNYSSNTLNNFDSTSNNIHILSVDTNKQIIEPNLVSSNYEETGTEWSIVNNNNIKLTLRNINDNTRLHYNSDFYPITLSSTTLSLYFNSTITLKYLYITKNNFTELDSNDINNILNTRINNNEININITDNTSLITNFTTNLLVSTHSLFKFTNFITLSKNSYNCILKNLNGYNIQFIGTYDYYAGSLWNKDTTNNNVYILKNVGINTNNSNNPANELDIMGNSVFTGNLIINNKLTTNILNSSQLNINGYTSVNQIEPYENSLIINPYKTPIGIASSNPSDFLDIGSNFKVKNNGNILLENLHIKNDINFTENKSLVHNNSSITLNTPNNIIYKLNNKTILNDNKTIIDLYSKLTIDKSTNHNENNGNSNNGNSNNEDILYINGNVNIYGDLTTNSEKILIYNPNNITLAQDINTENTIVSNLLHSDGFLYTDTLETTSINIQENFNLPIQNNDIPLYDYPYIYYNQITNKYMIYNNNICTAINTTTTLLNFSNIVKIFSYNASNLNYINTTNVSTTVLENNKIFNLNSAQINYNVNTNNPEVLINNNKYYFDMF